MATMRAVQVPRPKGPLELVEREIPAPGPGMVRIKVQACGVCHSDSLVKEGAFPGIQYPRVPGHEIVGIVDAVGPDVAAWKPDQRVGVGWHGGYCGWCDACRRGNFFGCQLGRVTGISFDGGYSHYTIVPVRGVARIPDELSFVEAAPLLCAGITTFNSLRHSAARPGDVVAVIGIGGLGHLAVQFARKMGFITVAVSRGADKKELAIKLGAHHYIDSEIANVGEELMKLGGAKVVLVTATSPKALDGVINGLGPRGQILIVGALVEAAAVNTLELLSKNASITGWSSGDARDAEDTMKFAVASGIRAMVEEFPFDKVNEAFNHMMSNKARFRVVLNVVPK